MKKFFINLIPIILIFLLAFGVGFGLTLYFKQNSLFNPLVQRLVIISAMGIGTGLSVHFLLRRRHIFWRIFLVILVIPITLFILDRLIPTNYSIVFFQGDWRNPIWGDFIQIIMGLILAIFFQSVSVKPKREIVSARSRLPQKEPKVSNRSAMLRKPAAKKIFKKKSHNQKKISRKNVAINKSSILSTKSVINNREIVLLGHTEHRCPYCLELVKKNDPRGVVICPECKTWHHKDCWDITGTCQVAHRHKL